MPDSPRAPGGRRVVVKFHPDARPPHSPDRGKAVAGPDWENLAALFPGIVWEPYFAGIHPAVLRKFDRLKPAFGTEPFAFETYYVVDNAADHDRDKIARELKKWKGVQTAYAEPGLAPPPSTVDPLNAAQGYQDDAPRGIGSRSFSANTGIAGADIGFIDVERGWKLDHEDLLAANIPPLPVWGENRDEKDHGTATLGVVVATAGNLLGGKGIAPAARTAVVSIFKSGVTGSAYPALALLHAACALGSGDVILVEHQIHASEVDPRVVPVEADLATFHVIRALSSVGIVVVEPAGNGAVDLDALADADGKFIFRTAIRDSGAILVGAARTVDFDREPSTNFGRRINCFAWGDNIRSTSTDAAGTASTYTSAFGQTSGASAIVAGAALLLQSWRKFVHGAPFSVPRLRALLSHTAVNTPSKDRVKDLIGYMPNLNAIRNHVETDDDSSIAQTLTEMAKRATRGATAKKLAKAARRILKDAGKRSKHER